MSCTEDDISDEKLTAILYIVQILVFIVQVLQVFLINAHGCVLK